MTFDYPVFMKLTGVKVLVVGGGQVATRKAEGLFAAGATITVVAPIIHESLVELAVECRPRPYVHTDLDGHRLVITATDNPLVNAQVAIDADAANVWANSADDPDNCTFILPAVARDGAVSVAISTGGSSPALASHMRAQAQQWLTDLGAANAAEMLSQQRAAFHAAGVSTETVDWSQRLLDALRPGRVHSLGD